MALDRKAALYGSTSGSASGPRCSEVAETLPSSSGVVHHHILDESGDLAALCWFVLLLLLSQEEEMF